MLFNTQLHLNSQANQLVNTLLHLATTATQRATSPSIIHASFTCRRGSRYFYVISFCHKCHLCGITQGIHHCKLYVSQKRNRNIVFHGVFEDDWKAEKLVPWRIYMGSISHSNRCVSCRARRIRKTDQPRIKMGKIVVSSIGRYMIC